jgi:hemolysin activation/secretion protein
LLLLALPPAPAIGQIPPAESPGGILPPLVPPRQPEIEMPTRLRVFVQRVIVVGNTALPPEALTKVTERYENRYLYQEDLQALRVELTRLYVDGGYVNSGVILPDQTIREDGRVTYQVIEGV